MLDIQIDEKSEVKIFEEKVEVEPMLIKVEVEKVEEPPKKLEVIIQEAITQQPPPIVDASEKKIVKGRLVSKSPIKPYQPSRTTKPLREDIQAPIKISEPEPELLETQRLDP